MKKPIKPSSPSMRRILLALRAHGPMTIQQIASAVHVAESTLTGGGYLKHLRDLGLIHVHSYKKLGGMPTWRKFWAFGPGADAVRKPPLTRAERSRKHREKVRQQFGSIANRILKSRNFGGSDRIVLDGVKVYERHQHVKRPA